jgi:hypothetical protein
MYKDEEELVAPQLLYRYNIDNTGVQKSWYDENIAVNGKGRSRVDQIKGRTKMNKQCVISIFSYIYMKKKV